MHERLTAPVATRLAPGEKAVRFYGLLLLFYLTTQPLAVLRLLGVINTAPILLSVYRVLDVIFLLYCVFQRVPVRLRGVDWAMLLVVLYPIAIGVVQDQINLTLLHDVSVYVMFVLKVILLRSALLVALTRRGLDEIFAKFGRQLIFVSAAVAAGTLVWALTLVQGGAVFYFQAQAEVTLAVTCSLVSSHGVMAALFLIYALLAGKRMILVGLTVAFAVFLMARWRTVNKAALVGGVGVLVLMGTVVANPALSTWLLPSAVDSKLNVTRRSVTAALDQSNAADLLYTLDPDRYAEVVSLWDSLEPRDLIFGAGYGFRYSLDASMALAGGEYGETVTNAHFSPLGALSKFGIIGLLVWCVYALPVLGAVFRERHSKFRVACGLAMIALIVESFFAYGLFINMFTPFLLAVVSVRAAKPRSAGVTQARLIRR